MPREQQELGLFSACKLRTSTESSQPSQLKLLIPIYTRTQKGTPDHHSRGSSTLLDRLSSIPQRFPAWAGYPTLPQGALGQAEIALSQPVQAQSLCVPSVNPCPLPACFSFPRRCRRG